jgi:hypothetical protein
MYDEAAGTGGKLPQNQHAQTIEHVDSEGVIIKSIGKPERLSMLILKEWSSSVCCFVIVNSTLFALYSRLPRTLKRTAF